MAQWVKDWRGRSCGVGRRAAGVESLAWELPYAAGAAKEEIKNKRVMHFSCKQLKQVHFFLS